MIYLAIFIILAAPRFIDIFDDRTLLHVMGSKGQAASEGYAPPGSCRFPADRLRDALGSFRSARQVVAVCNPITGVSSFGKATGSDVKV